MTYRSDGFNSYPTHGRDTEAQGSGGNRGAHFNRFGIITTHIDGNGQTVYFDDLTYTVGFVVPEPAGCAAVLVLMLVGFRQRSIRCAARRT